VLKRMALFAVAIVIAGDVEATQQEDSVSVEVRFRNGTVLRTVAPDSLVPFRQVSDTGEISEMSLSLSEIQHIRLTTSTAGELVAGILRLVDQLNDQSFHIRNSAETQLVERGLPYVTLLEQHARFAEPEGKYRLARVLDHLKNDRDDKRLPSVLEFDRLDMVDGRVMEGDLGQLDFGFSWRGQQLKTDRSHCQVIVIAKSPMESTSGPPAAIADRLLTSIENFLTANEPRPGTKFINFETINGNVAISSQLKEPVDNLFDRYGARFSSDNPGGTVIVSGYKFKQGVSRQNSICTLYVDPGTGKSVKYKGPLRIRFCEPDHPSMPAAVHSVGANMEIVDKGKTVLEAFNSAGHVIGTVMSSKDRSSFLGISSRVPIVALRASHNYYLFPDTRNDDFAIDDLCFEEPAPAPELNPVAAGNGDFVVVSRNRDRMAIGAPQFEGVALNASLTMAHTEQPFSLPLEEIEWLLGPQTQLPACEHSDRRAVMLADGSVVHVPQEGLASLANSELVLDPAGIIGGWNASVFARYPTQSDFEKGNVVVALPLHRVVGQGSIDWNADNLTLQLDKSTTLRQAMPDHELFQAEKPTIPADLAAVTVPMNLCDLARQAAAHSQWAAASKGNSKSADKQNNKADDSPEEPEIAEMTLRISEISNVWLAAPPEREAGTGLLRLNDGQQFVLGGKSGFVFKSISTDEVVIGHGEHVLRFPMSNLHALQFPPR
jgi:hypothetical protein